MKLLLHLLLVALSVPLLQAGTTTIRIKVDGAPSGTTIRIVTYAEPIEWTIRVLDSAKLSPSTEASLKVNTVEPLGCWISMGEHNVPLFVIPDTDVQLTARWNDLPNSVQFRGDNQSGNNFLALSHRTTHAEMMSMYKTALDVKPFKHRVDSLRTAAWQQFIDADTTQMPPIFREWVRRILVWDYIRGLGSFKTKNDASIKNLIIREMNVEDTSFAEDFGKVAAIRVYLEALMPDGNRDHDQQIANILDHLSGTDKEIQLSAEMIRTAIPNSQSDDRYEIAIDGYRRHCSNPRYRELVERAYESARALRPGSSAPSISAIDSNGVNHDLSELRGSYTYVLFWRSTCTLCMDQFTECTKLRSQTAPDKVNVVLINIRDAEESWRNANIDSRAYDHNWYADEQRTSAIDLVFGVKRSGFRSILLDKEGKIIQVNMLARNVRQLITWSKR